MRVLLVDNSKPECAIFTPKLLESLSAHATVVSCPTRESASEHVDDRWDAIVLSGSSLNVSQSLSAAALSKDLMMLLRHPDVPCLGVCFGMQLMAVAYGGEVRRLDAPREGVRRTQAHGPLIAGSIEPFFSHQDVVTTIPPDFEADAMSDGMIVGMHSKRLRRFGVQYHPECSNAQVASVLQTFLRLARSEQVPVGVETRVSRERWQAIAMLIGRQNPRVVAREHRVSLEAVVSIWADFRAQYRVPPILF